MVFTVPAIEVVAEGFDFVEGPALAPDGAIYFSDIPNAAVHRFDPETGETTLLSDESGGANGLFFLPDGRLLACEGGDPRQVALWKLHGQGVPRYTRDAVVTGHYNGPNDAVIRATSGHAFFTDPNYAKRADPAEFEGVYRVDLNIATKSIPAQHTAAPVIRDLVRPNGIGLSPDQNTLYVADNTAKLVMAYPLDDDANVGEGALFHDTSDLGGPDGMCVDAIGRLYVAIYGKGILILSPNGTRRIGFIPTGPKTTNCAFGADGKTLYVTAEGALKRMALPNANPAFPPPEEKPANAPKPSPPAAWVAPATQPTPATD